MQFIIIMIIIKGKTTYVSIHQFPTLGSQSSGHMDQPLARRLGRGTE